MKVLLSCVFLLVGTSLAAEDFYYNPYAVNNDIGEPGDTGTPNTDLDTPSSAATAVFGGTGSFTADGYTWSGGNRADALNNEIQAPPPPPPPSKDGYDNGEDAPKTWSKCWRLQKRTARRECRLARRQVVLKWIWGLWLKITGGSQDGEGENGGETENDDGGSAGEENAAFETVCGITCEQIEADYDSVCTTDDGGPDYASLAENADNEECGNDCSGSECGFGTKELF